MKRLKQADFLPPYASEARYTASYTNFLRFPCRGLGCPEGSRYRGGDGKRSGVRHSGSYVREQRSCRAT
jgi:hypothetical protein